VEVALLGTAVAGTGASPEKPWLSDLSGQDWWALHRAGYTPAGLVYGHCAWFILTRAADAAMDAGGDNAEYTHHSRAIKRCRDIAAGKMQEMARAAAALGVVGVQLRRERQEVSSEEVELTGSKQREAGRRTHYLITFSLIGTAVRHRPSAPAASPATRIVLSLRGGRLAPTAAVTLPQVEE
jgi:hypothetical protein